MAKNIRTGEYIDLHWKFGLKRSLLTPIVEEKLEGLKKLNIPIIFYEEDALTNYGIECDINNESDDIMEDELFEAFNEVYQVIGE